MKSKKIFLKLLVILFVVSCSKSDDSIPLDKVNVIELHSNIINEDYILYIYLPPSYKNSTNTYPVLYQLDADFTMELTINNAESLSNNREFIIVGIDYVGDNKRNRDFTPTFQEDFADSGGANLFYDFLKVELIPFIDSNYRVDTNFGNTLKGHSLGGLFATVALFKHNENPNLFKNYLIESPSLWWDDGLLLHEEEDFAQNNNDLVAKIYVSVGELEQVIQKAYFEAFQEQILSRNNTSLQTFFRVMEDATHGDVRDNLEAFTFIFN